ncbi:MAG: rhodanese-like domain-containing protein [Firmicutes bacterium]|nr:rhodanese-like domain-containing protein [Bacillota bacterium]
MKKIFKICLFIFFITLVGCSSNDKEQDNNKGVAKVIKISTEEANKRLGSEKDVILVDVRTPEEYKGEHIKDAILLPLDTISKKAGEVIPDKEAIYFVYCRSGNRSATASSILVEMGYKNIFDLGGIIDWPYETASGL